MREWHFYDKVYRRWIVLFIGKQTELPKLLKRDGYKYWDDEFINRPCAGMHISLDSSNNDKGNYCHVLWLRKNDLDTLVHELGHLVMHIFKEVGVIIDEDNQEPFTFYQEFWFKEIRDTVKKYPKGRSWKKAL